MNADQVADYGRWFSGQYGLSVTSHTRTPERNAQVGGAPNSDHLTGLGIDLAGDPDQMAALAAWANDNTGPGRLFRYVEYGTDDHQDHVHLSFNADAEDDEPVYQAQGEEEVDDDGLASDATPEEIKQWITSNMPEFAPFLANDEILNVVVGWVRDDAPDGDLAQRIRQTDYWQSHGPSSREFDRLLAEDPVAAQQTIEDRRRLIDRAARRQGIVYTEEHLGNLAKLYIRGGWNETDLQRFLADELRKKVTPDAGLEEGEAALTADGLVALARDYGVKLSKGDASRWALEILDGTQTNQSITQRVVNLAKQRWRDDPHVLDAITQGGTARDAFSQHIAEIADALELDADTIDLFGDNRWREVLQVYDPQTKERRAMTINEAGTWARHRPEYANTSQYRQQTAALTSSLLRIFGEA